MANNSALIPMNIQVPIVDPERGTPTPEFLRVLQKLAVGSGLTINSNGTVSLSDMNYQRVLGRNSAGSGPPEEVTVDQLMTWLVGSSAQGDIIYKGASGWDNLPAGTSGQFLKTNGAGADPAWATPSGGGGGLWWFSPPGTAGFSLISGDATNPTWTVDSSIGTVFDFNSNSVAGDIVRAAVETITTPAAAWSYEFKIAPTVYSPNYCGSGFILRNVANNKNLIWMLGNDGGLYIQRRSMTAFVSTPSTTFGSSNANFGVIADLFFKVTYDGSSVINFFISSDGKFWRKVYSETVAAFLTAAPDRIGFGCYTSLAGNSDDLNVSVSRRIKSW